MKQLILFTPYFTPSTKTVDFSAYPNFAVGKLYAIINLTQNTPIYVPGAPGLGMTSMPNPTSIVLQYDTTLHNNTDELNVYYDVAPGFESNTPLESGGNLQRMQELLELILVEQKVMNFILGEGLNIKSKDDIQSLRNDVINVNNISTF
jgi:hypothetical protein